MIDLTGITEGTPIGFMAAVGLLRVLNEDCDIGAGLSWCGGHAVLTGVPDRDFLLSELQTHMETRHQDLEWTWAPSPKRVTPERYLEACSSASGNRRALAFLAGFGTDAALTDDGNIRPTRLDMTSGQQKLIADLRKLAETLSDREYAAKAFASTLFDRAYEKQATFGWDPVAVRKHGYEAKAPMLTAPPGRPAEVWLAAESLALHPVLPDRGYARTTGCERFEGKGLSYFWATWGEAALNIDEVGSLRALDYRSLSRRAGVDAIWCSMFGSSGKYGMLLPGRRVS